MTSRKLAIDRLLKHFYARDRKLSARLAPDEARILPKSDEDAGDEFHDLIQRSAAGVMDGATSGISRT